ncbi:hypothetical protein LSH36_419g03031 [Paralvinella palmiformis]|uniref:PKD/REJ-like domain-containing protein n=1 Tax=Paralvinella palmiformis TaxID=53620 RepID=A0AAD9MZS4_9ANNE|nr:hypothetical protein LSH36_419g03031 [Paralvinella palmiformis]
MGTAESGNLNLANSKSLDLQVLGTDFTAKFQSGSYKQVRISDQVSSIVEVKNPDQPDDLSGYFFTWFCYQYEVESGWAKDNVKLPSDADRIAIPSDDSRMGDNLGGCFNTGPGMLLVSDDYSNTLVLNTSFLLVNQTFVIEVIVNKNGNSATTKTMIAVESVPFVEVDMQ